MAFFVKFPREAAIWSIALIALALYHPAEHNHFSLCPLNALGAGICPGCGLGRSVAFLLKGSIGESLATHPLGIFAVIVLILRIVQLLKLHFQHYGQDH